MRLRSRGCGLDPATADRKGLTEWQTRIVQLSFDGHHNASIARLLDTSLGEVKDQKLRITTSSTLPANANCCRPFS